MKEKHRVRYRNKLEIIVDILKICKDGTLKTYVMYDCRLSYTQLVIYLNLCMTNGWLKKEGRLYQTTPKGKAFLQQVVEMLKILQKTETAYKEALKTVTELTIR